MFLDKGPSLILVQDIHQPSEVGSFLSYSESPKKRGSKVGVNLTIPVSGVPKWLSRYVSGTFQYVISKLVLKYWTLLVLLWLLLWDLGRWFPFENVLCFASDMHLTNITLCGRAGNRKIIWQQTRWKIKENLTLLWLWRVQKISWIKYYSLMKS